VKAALRGCGWAFLAIGLLGLAGCGADNLSEAEKAQKNLGAIPPTTGKLEVPGEKPGPSTYAERGAPSPTGGDYGKRRGGKR
jgi:hypothetical protein